jgi:putative flippase GtrA
VQIVRFVVVGTIGFAVDSTILLALVQGLHIAPLPARIASFLCAATVTYWLNRNFTFRFKGKAPALWLRYVLSSGVGSLINIGAFQAWVSLFGASSVQLVLGSAVGSVLALFFNFFMNRNVVFRA